MDWERHAQNWHAWWAGALERPLVILESPPRKRLPEELTRDFLLHKPVDQVLDYYQTRLAGTHLSGDAWPKWFPFFGAGAAAAFLGAELLCAPDEGTIWFEPSQEFQPENLESLYDPQNNWWRRIQQLTQAAVDFWGDRVCVGFTDLGGNLDILASLRNSQDLLMNLMDTPAEIEAAVQQVTQLWLRYYAQLRVITQKTGRGSTPWAPIWAPDNCYMLQSDFSAMISPKMFARFVLPDLERCCQELDYAFYHLDGKGQIPHLDMLLSIEKLRGIQWVPGDGQPPPEGWLPVLKRIRAAGKLCQLYVTAAGAQEIIHNLGGKGFAFYITDALDDMAAQAFLDEISIYPEIRPDRF
jgi:5-methyltetrahydrofolate--homocysteine methyltransferase